MVAINLTVLNTIPLGDRAANLAVMCGLTPIILALDPEAGIPQVDFGAIDPDLNFFFRGPGLHKNVHRWLLDAFAGPLEVRWDLTRSGSSARDGYEYFHFCADLNTPGSVRGQSHHMAVRLMWSFHSPTNDTLYAEDTGMFGFVADSQGRLVTVFRLHFLADPRNRRPLNLTVESLWKALEKRARDEIAVEFFGT